MHPRSMSIHVDRFGSMGRTFFPKQCPPSQNHGPTRLSGQPAFAEAVLTWGQNDATPTPGRRASNDGWALVSALELSLVWYSDSTSVLLFPYEVQLYMTIAKYHLPLTVTEWEWFLNGNLRARWPSESHSRAWGPKDSQQQLQNYIVSLYELYEK